MTGSLRISVAVVVLFASFLATTRTANAQIGISGGQAAAILVTVGAVAAGFGVLLYYSLRTPPTITGCAVSAQAGLTLQNEADHQRFTLLGETASIHPGDRVKLKGKRKKQDAAGIRSFLVESLKKDYGACPATP